MKSLGGTIRTDHGPAISEPASNVCTEWEGLYRGLLWLSKGRVAGFKGLTIAGDERVVIGQLTGTMRAVDSRCIGWRGECLDLLALLRLPWVAVKVPRSANALADSIAGGW